MIGPFANESRLTELKLGQTFDLTPRYGGTWSAGYALHHFSVAYDEASILRSPYHGAWRSLQLDVFGQYDTDALRPVALALGLRSHVFSQGRFVRWSPRVQARFFAARPVSAGIGLSRNYQFVHRLGLPNAASPDVWVMSTSEQPPAGVDNMTGGVYVKMGRAVFAQAEVYAKWHHNLRQHETSVSRTRTGSLLLAPWMHDNTAFARGLEVMVRSRLGPLQWTNSYTLSRVEIRNAALDGGQPFRADWDRTHQLTSYVEAALANGVSANAAWLFATGSPNPLAAADASEAATLPVYHRLDLSLSYRRALGHVTLVARAALFNVYDRANTWYRSPVVVPGTTRPPRPTTVNVDVYDLGLQPSFALTVGF